MRHYEKTVSYPFETSRLSMSIRWVPFNSPRGGSALQPARDEMCCVWHLRLSVYRCAFVVLICDKFSHLLTCCVGRVPGIHRFESSGAWSRQSMLSSSSQLRSARSSLSSRISHYLPTIHGGSARSSITSPFCQATPFSTRSNSPNNGAVGEVYASTIRNFRF